jgi:hypothetical protein
MQTLFFDVIIYLGFYGLPKTLQTRKYRPQISLTLSSEIISSVTEHESQNLSIEFFCFVAVRSGIVCTTM